MKNVSELVWSERQLLRCLLASRRFSTLHPLPLEEHLQRLMMLLKNPEAAERVDRDLHEVDIEKLMEGLNDVRR